MKSQEDWFKESIMSFGQLDRAKRDWVGYATADAYLHLKYLDEKGFGKHDVAALAEAQPLSQSPPESGVSESDHRKDPRPRADIVATAKSLLLFEKLRSAYESDDLDLALDCVYKFGKSHQLALKLWCTPGQGAENADDSSLRYGSAELATKQVQTAIGYLIEKIENAKADNRNRQSAENRKKGLRKKIRDTTEERNELLCQTAERLRAANFDDHNLAGSTKRVWDSGDLWERQKGKKIRTKQIRQILRDGGVLPPAKTKNGK